MGTAPEREREREREREADCSSRSAFLTDVRSLRLDHIERFCEIAMERLFCFVKEEFDMLFIFPKTSLIE